MSHIIGIDLGTRFSCASVWRNKRCEVIADRFGNRSIPSVVSFYKSARLVGGSALTMKDVDPQNTIYDVKRIIGRRITDTQVELVRDLVPYNIVSDMTSHQNAMVEIANGNQYRPEEICAYILIEIKRIATEYLGSVEKAVITVPAYFNDAQRQATLDAAKIAGLDVVKMINEPTAAALAYGLGSTDDRNVIIYDFGAGTLDVSLMNINNGVFQTLAVSGNSHLGGEDIDYLLMTRIINSFKQKNGLEDITISKLSQIKLKNAVEIAKKSLSSTTKTLIWVEQFYNGLSIKESLTRKTLESVCNELFIMAIKPIDDVIRNSKLTKANIHDVVLVGGSTKIPKIRKLITKYFDGDVNVNCTLNPDETVSTGASIYGHIMSDNSDPFTDKVVLLDIVSLSLGVETLQKKMTTIIPRGSIIPTQRSKLFTTDTDDQDHINIKIYEGERKLTKDNYLLGSFDLFGFSKAPKGHASIKITFNVDVNGILSVTALEKKSGVTNTVTISSMHSAKGRMSQAEIDKVIADASKYDLIDTMYSLKIGLVYQIKSLCEGILANIDNPKHNLSEEEIVRAKKYIEKTLVWVDTADVNDLKAEKKRISKNYCALIHVPDDSIKGLEESDGISSLFDEPDNVPHTVRLDIPDYEKDSMNSLKRIIVDMCRNILQIVNNPITHLSDRDKTFLRDYLDSVTIWTYVTTINSSTDFVAKIDEINATVESVMLKYDDNVFAESESFGPSDELRITCNTLKGAIESNYFSLDANDLDNLRDIIDKNLSEIDTLTHEECIQRIDQVNQLCNEYYESMTSVEQKVIEPEKQVNKITEDIDSLINNLPVYLEVDTEKLMSNIKVTYHQ